MKINKVQLNFQFEEDQKWSNEGIFNNLEDCMLHILFYESAILKQDIFTLLDKYKEFFKQDKDESNKN